MDNAKVAVGVGDAIVLLDRFLVEFGGALIAALVPKEGLLEDADARGGEFEDLRFGGGKEIELIWVVGVAAAFADAPIAGLGEVSRLDGKF